jgi:hypothetical protein
VGVERRPVHRPIALSTGPGGVAAAVPEAGLMTDEDFTGSELVPVGASARWAGDPLPGRRLHQIAQHLVQLIGLRRFLDDALLLWLWRVGAW